jgi:type IV pilus modification protein PilV
MNTFKLINMPRGFSMIEVLISVVILGFGLLALAALQTTIIRSSSETKAQTVALQLAKDKIEDLRSFQDLAGYNALTTGNDSINDSSGSLSGVNFTRVWTVTRFAYNTAGAVVSVTPNVGAITTAGTYIPDNEYKRVTVVVSWADANGAPQSIGLEDGLGAISPSDSSKTTVNNAAISQSRKPKVYIYDPGLVGGVIPIAIGNGSSTAASNPTPTISSDTKTASETLFEILTYAAVSGNILAQSRVETAVVHCTCSTANAPTGKGYRPTFWNGYRYASPTQTTDAPAAGWFGYNYGTGKNQGTTESDRCLSCCRDHRDPSGVAGAKFDPWRASHDHYLASDLTVKNPVKYDEACRLIRVDGFFRVAADFRNDYMGLLETNNSGTLTDKVENNRPYAPKAAAKTNYQDFTLKYLDGRFSSNTAYNYNYPGYSVAASSLESTYNLNDPLVIDVTAPASAATDTAKWLHGRALYVDFIEPEALDVIKKSREDCVDKSTQLKRNSCVLPFVPFTSINVTELADWVARKKTSTDPDPVVYVDDSTNIEVENNGFVKSLDTNIPTRGDVYSGSNPSSGQVAYAYTYIGESNAGLADFKESIDVDEILLNDTQKFDIKYTLNTDPAQFAVVSTLSTLKIGSPISTNTCNYKNSTKNYPCTAIPADGSGDYVLLISGYTKVSTNTDSVLTTCSTKKVSRPIIDDYDVVGIKVNVVANPFAPLIGPDAGYPMFDGVVGSTPTSDTTVITVGKLKDNDVLTLTLSVPVELKPTTYTCSGATPIWSDYK